MTDESTNWESAPPATNQTGSGTAMLIATGIRAARRKPGVMLLVWAIQFLVALIVAIPLSGAMKILAETGFSSDMAAEIDLALLFDMADTLRPALRLTLLNLLWALPLLGLIRAVATVGIINGVRDDGIRSFWSGIERYGLRSIAVALPYFLLTAVLQVGLLFVLLMLSEGTGEKAGVLLWLVAMPVGVAAVGVLTDCMRDYSQISLVVRNVSPVTAVGRGIQWPFRHPSSLLLYGSWAVVGILFAVLPLLLENWIPAATVLSIVMLTVAQQLAFFARAGVTVAWYGSEVAYHEVHAEDEPPLIAATDDLHEHKDPEEHRDPYAEHRDPYALGQDTEGNQRLEDPHPYQRDPDLIAEDPPRWSSIDDLDEDRPAQTSAGVVRPPP